MYQHILQKNSPIHQWLLGLLSASWLDYQDTCYTLEKTFAKFNLSLQDRESIESTCSGILFKICSWNIDLVLVVSWRYCTMKTLYMKACTHLGKLSQQFYRKTQFDTWQVHMSRGRMILHTDLSLTNNSERRLDLSWSAKSEYGHDALRIFWCHIQMLLHDLMRDVSQNPHLSLTCSLISMPSYLAIPATSWLVCLLFLRSQMLK